MKEILFSIIMLAAAAVLVTKYREIESLRTELAQPRTKIDSIRQGVRSGKGAPDAEALYLLDEAGFYTRHELDSMKAIIKAGGDLSDGTILDQLIDEGVIR